MNHEEEEEEEEQMGADDDEERYVESDDDEDEDDTRGHTGDDANSDRDEEGLERSGRRSGDNDRDGEETLRCSAGVIRNRKYWFCVEHVIKKIKGTAHQDDEDRNLRRAVEPIPSNVDPRPLSAEECGREIDAALGSWHRGEPRREDGPGDDAWDQDEILDRYGIHAGLGSEEGLAKESGLESSSGRYAVVRTDSGLIVKGNFVDECSPLYLYGCVLEPARGEMAILRQRHAGCLRPGDREAYAVARHSAMERSCCELDEGVVRKLFEFSGFLPATVERAAEAWRLLQRELRAIGDGADPGVDGRLLELAKEAHDAPESNRVLQCLLFVLQALRSSGSSPRDSGQGQAQAETQGRGAARGPGDRSADAAAASDPECEIGSLLRDPRAKTYVLSAQIDLVGAAYPKRVRFVRKMPSRHIMELYDMILRRPFRLCFDRLKPHRFLEELTYARLAEVREGMLDQRHLDPRDQVLSPLDKACVFLYHEVILASMRGTTKAGAARNPEKWRILGDSVNTYTDDVDAIRITVGSLSDLGVDERMARGAIGRLESLGVIVVEYVDAAGEVLGAGAKPAAYPLEPPPRGRAGAVPRPARLFSTQAYVYTLMLVRVLRGMGRRCAELGPIPARPADQPFRNARPFGLDAVQQSACDNAVGEPWTLITGGAGTGKTAVLNKIAERVHPGHVVVATLMSRTGKMLSDEVMRADTIHHYLCQHARWAARGGARNGDPHPLEAAIMLIVDEATVSGLPLLARFLFVLFRHGSLRQLVMAGHHWQLPSIEYGAVFRDLTKAFRGITFKLKTCHRTSSRVIYDNSVAIYKYHRTAASRDVGAVIPLQTDASFRFIETDDTWSDDPKDTRKTGRTLRVLEIVCGMCAQSYAAAAAARWGARWGRGPGREEAVALFRRCLWDTLNATHFLALRNRDVDCFNRIVHNAFFASGFLSGLGNDVPKWMRPYFEQCGVPAGPEDEDALEAPVDGLAELMRGERRRRFAERCAAGMNAVWVGEKFYFTQNDREKRTRNGEVLHVRRYVDVAADDAAALADLVTPATSDEDGGEAFFRAGHATSSAADGWSFPRAGPQHTFDLIRRRGGQVTHPIGGVPTKLDTYITSSDERVIRLVEVAYENKTVAWCQPIDRVRMGYEGRGDQAPNLLSRARFEDHRQPVLRLGQVTTIHKYQGAEQDHVVYIVGNDADAYSNCQHAYVACSRARKSTIVLGRKSAFTQIVRRAPTLRRTCMPEIARAARMLDSYETARRALRELQSMPAEFFEDDFGSAAPADAPGPEAAAVRTRAQASSRSPAPRPTPPRGPRDPDAGSPTPLSPPAGPVASRRPSAARVTRDRAGGAEGDGTRAPATRGDPGTRDVRRGRTLSFLSADSAFLRDHDCCSTDSVSSVEEQLPVLRRNREATRRPAAPDDAPVVYEIEDDDDDTCGERARAPQASASPPKKQKVADAAPHHARTPQPATLGRDAADGGDRDETVAAVGSAGAPKRPNRLEAIMARVRRLPG